MMAKPDQAANRLLIVDADPDSLAFAAAAGERLGYAVAGARKPDELRLQMADFSPTVLLLNPNMPDLEGMLLLQWLAAQRPAPAVIFMGVAESNQLCFVEEAGLAYGIHVSATLRRPVTEEALAVALARQLVLVDRITEQDLRRAVDRGQLCSHYQPKMRATAAGWEVSGIESLLRWQHPDHGLVLPGQFLALAERCGLMAGLTDVVLQTGIEQIGAWNRDGLRLALSVNLSSALFTDGEFPDRLGELLRVNGVDPEQLTLEITESAVLANPNRTVEIFSRLRLKRINLSLDDFGTGYSSLTQLYKLPFNEVKIDRSIGMDLPHTTAARTIVRSVVDLGHGLGLKVCCEGVESAAALEFLHRIGCDYVQGYHIARAMPAAAVARWIGTPNPLQSIAQVEVRRAS